MLRNQCGNQTGNSAGMSVQTLRLFGLITATAPILRSLQEKASNRAAKKLSFSTAAVLLPHFHGLYQLPNFPYRFWGEEGVRIDVTEGRKGSSAAKDCILLNRKTVYFRSKKIPIPAPAVNSAARRALGFPLEFLLRAHLSGYRRSHPETEN
jgi:hypothetical protein